MTQSNTEIEKLLLVQRINTKRSKLRRLLGLPGAVNANVSGGLQPVSEENSFDEMIVACTDLLAGLRQSEMRLHILQSSIRWRIGALIVDALTSPRSVLPEAREILSIARRRVRERFPFRPDSGRSDEGGRATALAIEQVAVELHPLPPRPAQPESLASLRVAAILDPFSHQSFAPECDLVMLDPETWAAQLSQESPHFLLVESAWQGRKGEWAGLLQGDLTLIRSIVGSFREAGIPTVFWNKEDPLHFHSFIDCAALFDHVFTSDASSVRRYRQVLGHDRVGILPFALQPLTHHPFSSCARASESVFAGAWYGRMPDRCEDFERVADALALVAPLSIHDRHSGAGGVTGTFPKRFAASIRPSIPYESTGALYRSHLIGVNLNTVKQSPTMFARRVFELIGCNASVYGNHALGLRLLLGDLTVATDDPAHLLVEAWRENRSPDGLASRSRRLQALRKVLTEHTWTHRLGRIAASALGGITPSQSRVWILAQPRGQEELRRVLSVRSNYRDAGVGLLLRGVGVSAECPDFLEPDDGSVTDDDWIVPIHCDDYHGPHYLEDLLLARAFRKGDAVGKASWFRFESGEAVQVRSGLEYCPVRSLGLRRSAFRRFCWSGPLTAVLDNLDDGQLQAAEMVSIDAFSYLEHGATQGPGIWDPAARDPGLSLAELEDVAWQVGAGAGDNPVSEDMISGGRLAELLLDGRIPDLVSVQTKRSDVEICSFLQPGSEAELLTADISRSELERQEIVRACLFMPPTDQIKISVICLGVGGREISRVEMPRSAPVHFAAPVGVTRYRISIKVTGSVVHPIEGLRLGDHIVEGVILGSDRLLVVCNAYPEPAHLYRNAFVHRRVLAYRKLGYAVDVAVVRRGIPERTYDFEGVLVRHCSPEALARTLDYVKPAAVAVHFLDEDIWKAVRSVAERVKVVVWLHGSEIQSWRRREFIYEGAEREQARAASDARSAFWRGLLCAMPSGLRLVFVSRLFAEQTWADLDIEVSPEIWSVIHNPIDTGLFEYQEKTPALRTRVLSVRPHASKIYANDLVAAVVHRLAREPVFGSMHFTLVGDGELWLDSFASLDVYPNVDLQRRFVSQSELARLHREHGIFLVPTRGDTQGVSRDEAMASGLVPVTNQAGAVPEFVDNQCGRIVAAEDVEAMAQALLEIVGDPILFATLSRRASERVRAQSDVDAVVAKELAVLGLTIDPHFNQSVKNS